MKLKFGILYKVTITTLIPVVILALSSILLLYEAQNETRQYSLITETYSPLMLSTEQVLRSFFRWDDDLNMATLAISDHKPAMANPQIADALLADGDAFNALLAARKEGLPSADDQRILRELTVYRGYSNEVISAIHRHKLTTAVTVQLVTNANISSRLVADLNALKVRERNNYLRVDQQLTLSEQALRHTLYTIPIIALLLSLSLGIFLSRHLVRRIRVLIDGIRRVAEGDRHNLDAKPSRPRDEIDDAFTTLIATAKQLETSEWQLQEQVNFRNRLLNALPVPIFYKGVDGRFIEVNRTFKRFHGFSGRQLLNMTVADLAPANWAQMHQQTDQELLSEIGSKSYEAVAFDATGQTRDMIFHKSTFLTPDGQIGGIIGIMIDITDRKNAEKNIQHLSQIYAALAQTNQTIVHIKDEQRLFDEVCRIAVEYGGMGIAWIGVPDETTGNIVRVAQFGDLAVMQGLEFNIRTNELNSNGLVGQAILEQHPVIVQSDKADARDLPWRERVLEHGLATAASFPIRRGGEVYGALTVFHSEENIFDPTMIALFEEMSMDIGFALDQYDIEAMRVKAEVRFRTLYEQSHDAMMTVEPPDWNFTSANPATLELFGVESEVDFMQLNPWQVSPEQQPDGSLSATSGIAHIQSAVEQGVEFFEWTHRRTSGETFFATVLLTRMTIADEVIIQATVRDITAQKQAEQALLAAEQRWKDILDFLPDATFVIDNDARVISWNRAMETMTGIAAADIVGKGDFEYALPFYGVRRPMLIDLATHFDESIAKEYNAIWLQENTYFVETIATHLPGGVAHLSATASALRSPTGEVIAVIESIRDITERKLAEEQIQKLAHFDHLTGLPNRALLMERTNHLINQSRRNEQSLAMLFLDLDHFKNINDTLGHKIGDMMLIEVAHRLSEHVRFDDMVSRLGGDEFVVLLPDTSTAFVTHQAEELIQVISEPYHIDGYDLTITPSIGIAVYPIDGDSWETLYRHADIAMYRAKKDGRNAYSFFTPSMQRDSARRLQLEHAMRLALERNEFTLHYQPIISLNGDRKVCVEALLRWQHPTLGQVSPAEFIPVAEETGMIIAIGEWVLRTAIRQMKNWLIKRVPVHSVAVNLSALQLKQINLPQQILDVLFSESLPPDYLELEITESVAMRDTDNAYKFMDIMHRAGVRISIDDFGTGYSSLAYLNRFPIDNLKIDQSFVRNLESNQDDIAIVRAVISLAKSLRMRTIAEGVDSEQKLRLLRKYGCDEVQGYLFSRPLPPAQLVSWLKTTNTNEI